MSSAPRSVILGDWGTSNCRLRLYEENRGDWRERDRRKAPGVKFTENPKSAFFDAAAEWTEGFGATEVYLCGMIGSNIGWREVSYLDCPVSFEDIADRTTRFVSNGVTINIVPGLSGKNFVDAPDVMRGEETQLLEVCTNGETSSDRSLFCLPGTHTKWVVCSDRKIESFQTSPSGELFEILTKYSTLVASQEELDFDVAAFREGLDFSRRYHDVGVLHQLFSVRSKWLLGESNTGQVRSYCSGILIGSEIEGMVNSQVADIERGGVSLISSGALANIYGEALGYRGIAFSTLDGDEAAFAGLKYIANYCT